MTLESSKRESDRVRELANEYRRKGYGVHAPSNQDDVPDFLRGTNYIPDLVVQSPRENLVIEVKARRSESALKQLSNISELVNRQPGWEFVLVFVFDPDLVAAANADLVKIRELLDKATAIGAPQD